MVFIFIIYYGILLINKEIIKLNYQNNKMFSRNKCNFQGKATFDFRKDFNILFRIDISYF